MNDQNQPVTQKPQPGKSAPPMPNVPAGGSPFPFISLGGEDTPSAPSNLPPVITALPKKRFGGGKIIATILGLLVLVGSIGAGVILTRQKQEIRNKAASTSKSGCSSMCSGNPPDCKGDVTIDISGNTPAACSSVTVPGMPDSMDAWAIVNPTYNQAVNCVARDNQKANCSCQIPNGGSYCWMGLESLVKNADGQGHRWAMYVYDKGTNQLKSGGPTTWVLYDDNGSRVSRWGNSLFLSTDSVLHCGERKEYREQADLYSPGSWNETGQVIYAEPTGCTTATPTPTSCNRCSTVNGCERVQFVNPGGSSCDQPETGVSVTRTTDTTNCHPIVGGDNSRCAPTPTPTPGATAQCTNIQAFDVNWTKITDLSKLKAGDKVRFTVAGFSTAGNFDKARFTINGSLRSEVTQTRPSSSPIEFYDEYTIPTGTTTFDIKAELHHSTLGWL